MYPPYKPVLALSSEFQLLKELVYNSVLQARLVLRMGLFALERVFIYTYLMSQIGAEF